MSGWSQVIYYWSPCSLIVRKPRRAPIGLPTLRARCYPLLYVLSKQVPRIIHF